MRAFVLWGVLALLAVACSPDTTTTSGDGTTSTSVGAEATDLADAGDAVEEDVGDAGDAAAEGTLEASLDALVGGFTANLDPALVQRVVDHGEPGAGWLLADLLRFYPIGSDSSDALVDGLAGLGFAIDDRDPWSSSVNQLIAQDLPAPDGYDRLKVQVLSAVDARWQTLFSSPLRLDLRIIGWGGVFIDDRPFGDAAACFGRGCIPALDLPSVTDAAGGDWYDDDRIVFGIVVNGEARAYPKHQMQVHEMVNDVVGGRRIGMPYCTLCGSAQAYFTDEIEGIEEPLVLRTSGLLSRSNKVMYDLNSNSIFDTFTGVAVSGQLADAGIELEQISVRVATWGEWKAVHPDTTIVAADGGVGRVYSDDPLLGRDDNGPIFPIGDADERLGVQDAVVGVIAPDGTPIAFSVAALDERRAVLSDGTDAVVIAELRGVEIRSDGAGYFGSAGGEQVATHEAFWFAWSQFWPATELWEG